MEVSLEAATIISEAAEGFVILSLEAALEAALELTLECRMEYAMECSFIHSLDSFGIEYALQSFGITFGYALVITSYR